MSQRIYRCCRVVCVLAVFGTASIFALGAPPLWDYEELPSSYDDCVVLFDAKAVENPATGEPALCWRTGVFESGFYIRYFFAQRTSEGWPVIPEVIADVPYTFRGGLVSTPFVPSFDFAVDSDGIPSVVCCTEIGLPYTGTTKYIYYAKRTGQGWPASLSLVDSIELSPVRGQILDIVRTLLCLDLGPNNEPGILYTFVEEVYDLEDENEPHLYDVGRLLYRVLSDQSWVLAYNEAYTADTVRFDAISLTMNKSSNSSFVGRIGRRLGVGPIQTTRQLNPSPTTTSWSTPTSITGQVSSVSGANHSVCLTSEVGELQGAVFEAAPDVLYHTEFDGTDWSTPESIAFAINGRYPGTLNYLEGVPQLVIGADEVSNDDGEVLVLRYLPSSDTWSYLSVAEEQEHGHCAMAVNSYTGMRNVFLEGNGTGIDGKTLMAYKSVWFHDDFNDGDYNGWSVWSGSWSAANGYLRMAPGSPGTIAKANTDNDLELRFSYVCNDTSDNDRYLIVSPRYAANGDRIYLFVKPANITLNQRVNSVWTSLDGEVVASAQGTKYYLRVLCDGTNVEVYRNEAGTAEQKILETSACTVASTKYVSFTPNSNADFGIDNVTIRSDDYYNP